MLLSTDLGEMKIPEPMMVPTMMQMPLSRPTWDVGEGRGWGVRVAALSPHSPLSVRPAPQAPQASAVVAGNTGLSSHQVHSSSPQPEALGVPLSPPFYRGEHGGTERSRYCPGLDSQRRHTCRHSQRRHLMPRS